jgi:hypothetical protein
MITLIANDSPSQKVSARHLNEEMHPSKEFTGSEVALDLADPPGPGETSNFSRRGDFAVEVQVIDLSLAPSRSFFSGKRVVWP